VLDRRDAPSRGGRATQTLLLGLIGASIQRSRTPAMHEGEAAAYGIHCLYQLLDLDDRPGVEAAAVVEAAERVGFAGLNVTHPCKQSIMASLTELSEGATGTGAVNTIVLRDGRRIGHNTDWSAFRASVTEGLPGASFERVVQLGAGGAGAATAYAALVMGARHLHVVDAVPERAHALCARLGAQFPGRVEAANEPDGVLRDADGLIHATPTGMHAHPGLPLAADLLRPDLWVAEVVYFPLETALLVEARRRGCRTLDGSGMAVWQAVEAFSLFTGLEADPSRMRRAFDAAGEGSAS
jgi:shikimate dehydrogenase